MEERRLFSNIRVIIIINFFFFVIARYFRQTFIIDKRGSCLLESFLLEQRDKCYSYMPR